MIPKIKIKLPFISVTANGTLAVVLGWLLAVGLLLAHRF
jgi:hypothetical protein